MTVRLGYLASGAASSARGIHEAAAAGTLDVHSAVLIANNSTSGALGWARSAGIPGYHLSGVTHPDSESLDAAIRDALLDNDVDLVVLSGYAKRVGPLTLSAFESKILNVHPAPLPRFGGQGMYGMAVHAAVLVSGQTESAVTIHVVTEDYDDGPIVAACPVPIEPGDSAESLRERVHAAEPRCWVELLRELSNGHRLPGVEV